MSKSTTKRKAMPVEQEIDSEVLAFRRQFDEKSPLDELVRERARRMIQAAIDSEVEAFIERHSGHVNELGRRLVVKNGSLSAREILTGADQCQSSKVECVIKIAMLMNVFNSPLAFVWLT